MDYMTIPLSRNKPDNCYIHEITFRCAFYHSFMIQDFVFEKINIKTFDFIHQSGFYIKSKMPDSYRIRERWGFRGHANADLLTNGYLTLGIPFPCIADFHIWKLKNG